MSVSFCSRTSLKTSLLVANLLSSPQLMDQHRNQSGPHRTSPQTSLLVANLLSSTQLMQICQMWVFSVSRKKSDIMVIDDIFSTPFNFCYFHIHNLIRSIWKQKVLYSTQMFFVLFWTTGLSQGLSNNPCSILDFQCGPSWARQWCRGQLRGVCCGVFWNHSTMGTLPHVWRGPPIILAARVYRQQGLHCEHRGFWATRLCEPLTAWLRTGTDCRGDKQVNKAGNIWFPNLS